MSPTLHDLPPHLLPHLVDEAEHHNLRSHPVQEGAHEEKGRTEKWGPHDARILKVAREEPGAAVDREEVHDYSKGESEVRESDEKR